MQGQLGQRDTPLRSAFDTTQQLLDGEGGRGFPMNWMVAPLDGRSVHAHEGGTGGLGGVVPAVRVGQGVRGERE